MGNDDIAKSYQSAKETPNVSVSHIAEQYIMCRLVFRTTDFNLFYDTELLDRLKA